MVIENMIEVVKVVVMAVMWGRVLSNENKIISDTNFSVCLQGQWMLELYVNHFCYIRVDRFYN